MWSLIAECFEQNVVLSVLSRFSRSSVNFWKTVLIMEIHLLLYASLITKSISLPQFYTFPISGDAMTVFLHGQFEHYWQEWMLQRSGKCGWMEKEKNESALFQLLVMWAVRREQGLYPPMIRNIICNIFSKTYVTRTLPSESLKVYLKQNPWGEVIIKKNPELKSFPAFSLIQNLFDVDWFTYL